MDRNNNSPGTGTILSPGKTPIPAFYIYCIAPLAEDILLGRVGIENREVYSISHEGLAAIVHECEPKPYLCEHGAAMGAWILAHHGVVETIFKKYGSVLPMTFNSIIQADHRTASENVRCWIEKDYDNLCRKIERLAGKAEYGVQAFWEPESVCGQTGATPEMARLQGQIKTGPPGTAFLCSQRLSRLMKKEIELKLVREFRDIYDRLEPFVDGVQIGKVAGNTTPERQTLTNLACLVSREKYPAFEAEIECLRSEKGLSIRLFGPIPPYSFC